MYSRFRAIKRIFSYGVVYVAQGFRDPNGGIVFVTTGWIDLGSYDNERDAIDLRDRYIKDAEQPICEIPI